MITSLINYLLHQFSYTQVYLLTVVYFMVLYFGVGKLFLMGCNYLTQRNIVQQIVPSTNADKNKLFEIKHSFKSIVVFGFSGVAMVYLIRTNVVELLPETLFNTLSGIVILTLYNELHFYLVHKLLHLPVLYRTIHKIHHQSKIPTVYSVYSFHWVEALLLSTVPITIAPFYTFSATALFIYPLASILLNFAGHCNYRFGNGLGDSWKLFSTRHAQHHYKNSAKFGFALNLFDKLFPTNKKLTNQ